MADKKFWFGTLVMFLALGLVLAGCDDDSGDGGGGGQSPAHDTVLVAKWYISQDNANADGTTGLTYEFKSDGKLFVGGTDSSITWTTSGGKITTSVAGNTMGTADYSVTGTKLTLSNVGTTSGLTANDYYKKSG